MPERSGRDGDWVRSHPDLLDGGGQYCRDFYFTLVCCLECEIERFLGLEIPVVCDAQHKTCDALVGCQKPAEFYVAFHGCYSCCTCADHLSQWVYGINSALADGGVYCEYCRGTFSLLPRVMTWRVI